MSVSLEAFGNTDVGQVRSNNQDAFLVELPESLFIVADGMGGHAGGEIASKLCVDEISRYLKENSQVIAEAEHHPDARINGLLANAINHASTKIYERALEDPSLKGMGTTATACKIIGDLAYVAHVGDSRLYLVRCGLIYQITHDHSLVSEQVRAGILSKEEAEAHHLRNVITRSVGYQEEEDVDTTTLELEDGDQIVICSDGLHGPVTDQEVSDLVQKDSIHATDKLIALANERGGEDNITTVIIKVKVS
jgi:protein phosphatase